MVEEAGHDGTGRPARRAVLATIGMGMAGIASGRTATQVTTADPLPSGMFVVDSLGSLDDAYGGGTPPIAGRDAISEAGILAGRQSGLTALNYTLRNPDFESAVDQIGRYDAQIRRDPRLRKVWYVRDIAAAKAADQIGIIYGWQNTLALDGKASRVDIFADLGVRIVQLTYNAPTLLGGGSMDPANSGLTPFGREVVARLNARRLVVDLSHSGERICLDAVAASAQPICISHTGCKAVAESPRNKTDAELRAVADRGGYVGIFFIMYLKPYSRYDSSAVIAHLEHAIRVCGEDHVGIGSDYGVIGPNRDPAIRDRTWAELIAARRKDGSAAEGDDPRYQPWPTDMAGPQEYRVLASALRRRGFSTGRIEKVFGRNFMRYLGDIWGG